MCHPGHNRSDRQVLKKSQGCPYEMSSNIFCKSCKQIKAYISPKNIELYTIQAVMCHPGHILRNKNDRQVLKKSKGRPYETSCNIFCNSFKQNYVYKSPKHIELFTIQPSMCHTGHISRNKRNHWVLRKFPRTPLWDVLEQILWQFKINWRQHISQKH